MSKESQELEAIKSRILIKQAKLFEERLDRYLQLESEELTAREKKEIFNSLLNAEEEKKIRDGSQNQN